MIRNGEFGDGDLKDNIYYKKIAGIHNLPIKIVVDEIDAGKKDGSIASTKPSLHIYLTAWALIAGFVKLSVFGGVGASAMNYVNLDDWKKQVFEVADKLLIE